MEKIRIAIVGALGYSGLELIKIADNHPFVELKIITSESKTGKIKDFLPTLKKYPDLELTKYNKEDIIKNSDVVFLALPTGASLKYVPELYEKVRIIDLSGAYRITKKKDFEDYYNLEHDYIEYSNKAVYGLSEIYSDKIKDSYFITNPGCYPTSVLIPMIPLFEKGVVLSNEQLNK